MKASVDQQLVASAQNRYFFVITTFFGYFNKDYCESQTDNLSEWIESDFEISETDWISNLNELTKLVWSRIAISRSRFRTEFQTNNFEDLWFEYTPFLNSVVFLQRT